jgi:hypothetical protein
VHERTPKIRKKTLLYFEITLPKKKSIFKVNNEFTQR